MSLESSIWLIGPFCVALMAAIVTQRRSAGWAWLVVIPPYSLLALFYADLDRAARASGFQRIDGAAIDLAWNALGVGVLLGTIAHIASQRRWRLMKSTIVAGLAGLVPGIFGIMGAGLVLGVVGAVVAAAIHMATRRGTLA